MAYNEFIVLNQARSAVIEYNNTRERNLMAIKRFNKIDKGLMHRLQPFTSDYIVNVRDVYFDKDNLVIIYK